MTRVPSVFLFLLLVFLIVLHQSMAAAAHHHHSIVSETCKHSANGDPNVNYTFCVESLQSVSKSKHADLRGLAIISARLAKADAKHAKSRVKTLLKAKKMSRYRKSCLQTCRELYSDAMASLRDSVKLIKAGRYGDANVYISSAVDAPGECEDSFKEGSIKSPLVKENHDLFQLAVIALSITSRLG
ncbi:putative invertase inhibitor [Musa acuminata AAA Group]|uniref:putative invertase inhibitor n=1 Tax=Musa acuminata AAA Group TaxID=214697 RepID=UPI0031E14941